MIQEEKHIKELWYIKHRNDKLKHTGFNYEENLFRRTMSGVMFDNPTLNEFLKRLQKQAVLMLESTLVIRNFWNYTVPRFYNKHPN